MSMQEQKEKNTKKEKTEKHMVPKDACGTKKKPKK
jgi:hypothetical protein